MKRIVVIVLVLTVSGLLFATPGLSLTPMPEESGISGFINIGAGGVTAKSNMIAGNDLADIGNKRIDSLTGDPESKSDAIPVINGELAYTFDSTRTQLFIGNRFEDFIRFQGATLAGIRQELPDKGIVEVGYLFPALPAQVWADPYVVGQDRTKTDRESPGIRLGYDRILGSDLEFRFSWRTIKLDDERSGLTQLGLTPDQAKLLDREGDSYQFQFFYPFRFAKGKHRLVPDFTYSRFDLDGKAMASDRYQGQLTYLYFGKIFNVATNLVYEFASYDETNPIYLKKREDDVFGASLSVFYKNLFNVPKMSLVGTVAGFESDANINFYDTTVGFFGLSVLYRF